MTPWPALSALLVASVLAAPAGAHSGTPQGEPQVHVLAAAPGTSGSPHGFVRREPGSIVRVLDGDTVDVRIWGQVERVGLIGLDAPRSADPRRPVECFGREATRRALQLLPGGTAVEIELDRAHGHRDRYGRLLAYLILPDGRNVAEVLLREGYGRKSGGSPYRYEPRFEAAEREARNGARGLWAPGACR